ncbi:protein trapped in endoderm-1-like isoform X1 [Homarus americanus]|uniref:protein trapped in endoderm-1-like isoform X1 n=1 Tax=Homarus americanus TaxID=6706 RepID=UPI001C45D874|nr:protein trapped in endoderm-1-like isoform X1 [Homarus americanus]XP_042230119.1 protein trapped in endoderm-1-like isoform X1 [Homarus americanus]XP_042230120.1 protein trapped in endoderm-1-like isoform X1 [Homarus americanus]
MTSEDNDDKGSAPDWAIVLTAVTAVIIAILGFFGNLLTILALPYTRRLRHSATYLVVNLAVAEGIFCVTILPISAAHLFTLYMTSGMRPLFDTQGCNVFVFLRYVNIQAELLSIAAIAVNRCVLIAVPKKYPQVFSGPKTAILIAAIWLCSGFLMLIPLLKIYGEFTYNHNTDECDFSDNTKYGQGPRKLFLALGFLLPCVVIIVSYSYIFYKARQSSVKLQSRGSSLVKNTDNSSSDTRPTRPKEGLRSRDIRIARTIGVIFLAFLLCCTPVSVVHYLDSKFHMPTLLLLLHPVYWAQYCINIFIYVFMNKQYRDAYVHYISRWWPNFKEVVSRTKFKWKEEPTSGDSRRQSRAATPSSGSRFNVRKFSKNLNPKNNTLDSMESHHGQPGTPKILTKSETPNLADTRL